MERMDLRVFKENRAKLALMVRMVLTVLLVQMVIRPTKSQLAKGLLVLKQLG